MHDINTSRKDIDVIHEYILLHSNRNLLFYNLFYESMMQLILGKNLRANHAGVQGYKSSITWGSEAKDEIPSGKSNI